MLETTVRARRKYSTTISAVLVIAGIAGIAEIATTLHRNRTTSPLSSLQTSPSSTPSHPIPDAGSAIDPTFLVLASMGTTPPGARIVRVSDGKVLGYTPETVEFHQSNQPELVRFELQGYVPVTREVPAVSDSVFRIVMEPIPAKRPGRAHSPKN